MSEIKKDIRSLSQEDISNFLEEQGEPKFRAKQIYQWLWQKSVTDFDDMTNLSKDLRTLFKAHFMIKAVEIKVIQQSSDGTVKVGFQLTDGNIIEGVIIPTDDRNTACISSQVGCSLDCKFCATGYLKRMRNISDFEIYDQVAALNKISLEKFGKPLTNIVYMGMGEPLLNYKNVLQSIEYITNPNGLGMSPRRITLSTSGVSKMIKKLADDDIKVNLAFSLHAPTNKKRSEIMSINNSNPLEEVIDALEYFSTKLKRKVTFEYVALKGFNENIEDADALAKLCSRLKSKINIISYNPIDEADFERSTSNRLDRFIQRLTQKGVQVSVRKSRGDDIDAACGQLANKVRNE